MLRYDQKMHSWPMSNGHVRDIFLKLLHIREGLMSRDLFRNIKTQCFNRILYWCLSWHTDGTIVAAILEGSWHHWVSQCRGTRGGDEVPPESKYTNTNTQIQIHKYKYTNATLGESVQGQPGEMMWHQNRAEPPSASP